MILFIKTDVKNGYQSPAIYAEHKSMNINIHFFTAEPDRSAIRQRDSHERFSISKYL